MNINFIAPKINLSGGGSNSNTDLRIRTLQERGHRVKAITLFSKYNKLPDYNPYEIIPFNKKPKHWILINLFVFKILKKYDKETNLFYIDGPQFLWGAGLYKLFYKKPVLIHLNVLPYTILEHGTKFCAEINKTYGILNKTKSLVRTKIGGIIDRYFAKKIDAFSCTSPIIKEHCVDFGFGEKNMHVIPEFIDTGIFTKRTKWQKDKKNQKKRLLYVGRLVACKGVDVLIKALERLNRKDIELDIVGDGLELEKLKKLAEKSGLDEQIHFHGWIKREMLGEIYNQADVFVHPARWAEPLGITIVEAMSMGLPVIVPEISGSAWASGLAGLKFKNGNAEDLANKIETLLDDDKLYKKLQGHTEQETEKMGYRKWTRKFENLIEELISLPRNNNLES